VVEVCNGWGTLPLRKFALGGKHKIPLNAGTVQHPLPINIADVHTERKGFFAGLKKAFKRAIKTQFKVIIKKFSDLLEIKKAYIRLLPGNVIIHKKLLPFIAKYRLYLGDIVLAEQLQHFKKIEQDLIVSHFHKVIDNPDIVMNLITYWDTV